MDNLQYQNNLLNHLSIFLGVSIEKSSTKYYIGNREKYANRWEKREIENEYETMYNIEMKHSIHAKLAAATKTGYTGLSQLYRPYKLYGFNFFLDMTHDVMHLVALNLCKKLFKRIFNEYIPQTGEINEKMQNFPLTPGNFYFCFQFELYQSSQSSKYSAKSSSNLNTITKIDITRSKHNLPNLLS